MVGRSTESTSVVRAELAQTRGRPSMMTTTTSGEILDLRRYRPIRTRLERVVDGTSAQRIVRREVVQPLHGRKATSGIGAMASG
jgi:hypothetical protein